jgi:hypothetical protein
VQLGSAAFVGIITGLALKLTASTVSAILRLDETDVVNEPAIAATTCSTPVPRPRLAITAGKGQTFTELFEDTHTTGSQDDDWTWLGRFGMRRSQSGGTETKPNIKAKRKAHALLSQTIMEESSSS